MTLVKMDDVMTGNGAMHIVSIVVEETSHNKCWQGIGERKEMGECMDMVVTWRMKCSTTNCLDYIHSFVLEKSLCTNDEYILDIYIVSV